jgi:hypothetical protein
LRQRAHAHTQVDAGSDDDQQLFAGLPATEAAAAALERLQRQRPLLALSRGYCARQRSPTGTRQQQQQQQQQYDDAAEAAAGCVRSPGWDLHSVAESMQQVGLLGRHQVCLRLQQHVLAGSV